MNKLCCFFLFTLLAVAAKAQDNIILKSGQEVSAKVLEVSKVEIKYKRTDNPDGPMYTMPAGDIFMIKYANGTKDILSNQVEPRRAGPRYRGGMFRRYYTDAQGARLGYPEVRGMMAGQPDAQRAFQRGRQLRTAALITAIPAVALLGTGIALAVDGHGGRDRFDNDPNGNGMTNNHFERGGDRAVVGAALAGGGLLLGVGAVILNHKATNNFRRAARYQAGSEGTSLQISPARQGPGASLALRF